MYSAPAVGNSSFDLFHAITIPDNHTMFAKRKASRDAKIANELRDKGSRDGEIC